MKLNGEPVFVGEAAFEKQARVVRSEARTKPHFLRFGSSEEEPPHE
jgi:hypothetical protein